MASSRLIFLLQITACWLVLAASVARGGNPLRLMVDLSDKPDEVLLSAFDLCIVQPDATLNLEAQQTLGNKVLARLNLFEVSQDSALAKVAQSVGIPLLEAKQPGYTLLDATHPNWIPLVVREITQNAAERGFDGFVLAGLDTISQDAVRAACLQAILDLDKAYPDKQIIIEGGQDLVAEARRVLDGVLFLGDAPTAYRDSRIREVKRLGVRPLVVECLPESISREDLGLHAQHLSAMGAVPFLTTPSLTGIHLGPQQEVTRDILVLHSGPIASSWTAQVLQGSLEWRGYKLRFIEACQGDHGDWHSHLANAKGVIWDASLVATSQQQPSLLVFAEALKSRRIPMLLTGIPWTGRDDFVAWAACLGLQGSGAAAECNHSLTLRQFEQAWLQEPGAIRPRSAGFRDLQAPAKSRVICSVQSGKTFDQAFLTSWGGMWVDPLAPTLGPQLQPLPFLDAWLGLQPTVPVMDVSSQSGRRLMIPYVGSEGFTAPTSLPGLPIAAEAMASRLLSHYSLPFTVAVCENEVRGLLPGQDTRDALRYETAARALFSLPQVHAASATRSRPADWSACPDMEQEVAGSMAWIHRQLLPTGRQVEMMLWPTGTAPTAEAIHFSHRMGVENVQLQPPRLLPGRTAPPPANSRGFQTTHQTLAPILRRPGGVLEASDFIRQARDQNAALWTSPLHILLSFHDVTTEAGLTEAGRMLDWCAAQPLHAMSASDHARLVRDASLTRLFQQAPGHWIIVNGGHARTLRLPATAGVPDLDRSIGIAGYSVRGPDLYIHTLGRRRTELVLQQDEDPAHLRLAASSGSIRYLEAGQQRVLLQVADLRPVELTFAGVLPGSLCQIFTNEHPQFVMADVNGHVEVVVPAQTVVRLQVLPAQQAAMR